ncbi:MAG: 50S ribosomal protein L29 [Planctomycetota bacterium]
MAKGTKNYAEMTDDELRRELETLVQGLFNLRFRKVTDVVEDPAAFKKHRREIARIKTILRAREIKALQK